MTSRCRDCGAPLYPRVFRQWNDDGTVTARHAGGNRVCHIESEALCAIIDGMSDRIGYPIDRVAIEGQRKATRRLTDDLMSVGRGAIGFITRSWAGSGLATDIILGVGRTAGHGLPQAIEYHRGEATSYKGNLTIRIDNPFSGVILAGMIRGVYRAVEGVEGRCEWARSTPTGTWSSACLPGLPDGAGGTCPQPIIGGYSWS